MHALRPPWSENTRGPVHSGLVVTSVPKVPIWKAYDLNALHRMLRKWGKTPGTQVQQNKGPC